MYDTKEWEDIRLKRGWSNLYIGGDDLVEFLKGQEKEMARLTFRNTSWLEILARRSMETAEAIAPE